MRPSLTINVLKLVASTKLGPVGRVIRFTDGLNLIRADNSSGKSTALQSIVYALGLEGMLSASHRIPLAHAMTHRVLINGVERDITESHVELQITNTSGESIVMRRSVVGATDSHLITVTRGPALTSDGQYPKEEYFVRLSGAAKSPAGFHRFLASFIGFELPRVGRMDGSEGPLYLETIFPYFYVEQKHGWTSLQARMPTYLGIRDVGRRSAEFVLGLEASERALRRQRLTSNLSELETQWQLAAHGIEESARSAKVVIQNDRAKIGDGVSDDSFRPVVSVGREWASLSEALERMRDKHSALLAEEMTTVGESAPLIELDLASYETALRQALSTYAGLNIERTDVEEQLNQVARRIDALEEDLQKHRDALTLEKFGAEHAVTMLAEHMCPTCHQDLDDGVEISAHAMSAAENIEFIRRQIATFSGSQADLNRVNAAMAIRQKSLSEQVHDLRNAIRVARDALRSPNSLPSAVEISKRIVLRERIDVLSSVESGLASRREALAALASQWADQKKLLNELTKTGPSGADEAKVASVETSVRAQLEAYGFDSLKPSDIAIDRVSYRPTNDGFDLGFDLSASDMIRVIWAYLFAMLDSGTQHGGNHVGLLIFDEPRQQDAARESYRALLRHAGAKERRGAQIIFATSENSASLVSMLADDEYNLIDLKPGERLLQVL